MNASRSARARSVHSPGRPSPIGGVLEAGHRQDPGHAAREERLVGLGQVARRQPALARARGRRPPPSAGSSRGSCRAGSRSRATGRRQLRRRGRGRGSRTSPRTGSRRSSGTGRRRRRPCGPRDGRRRSRPGRSSSAPTAGSRGRAGRGSRRGGGRPRDGRPASAARARPGRRSSASGCSSGGSRPRPKNDAARDRDADAGIAVGPAEALGGEQLVDRAAPGARRRRRAAGSRARPPIAAAGRRARRARSAGRRAPGASRRRRRRAGSRGRTRRGAGRRPARSARRPRRGPAVVGRHSARLRADLARRRSPTSGPRAFATVSSHSAAGSLRYVMPPPTWRLSRVPSATNVRIRIDVAIAPSGPIQPSDAGVRPAPHRLQLLEQLHRPDLRRARDRAARERGREQVERVATRRQPAGHRRDEVLDGGRPLEPAEARHADGARRADPAEVVAEDVDDHHVLGAVLLAREQLAGERAVLVAGPAARPGALDRVGRDVAVRGRPRGTAPARPTGSPRRPAPSRACRGTPAIAERRVAGPQPAVERPRVAVERRREAAGQVRLVDVAAGDELADGLDAAPRRPARSSARA